MGTASPVQVIAGMQGPDHRRGFVDVSIERDGGDIVIAMRDFSGARSTVTLHKSAASMLAAAMVVVTSSDDYADTYTARLRGDLDARERSH